MQIIGGKVSNALKGTNAGNITLDANEKGQVLNGGNNLVNVAITILGEQFKTIMTVINVSF